ncbi:MAG: hypothetical protein QOC82_852 [Frankiaceae bacterium]|jgi:hypothetical protein|nr:hypothetical protein [Frankiaceae bacterium]
MRRERGIKVALTAMIMGPGGGLQAPRRAWTGARCADRVTRHAHFRRAPGKEGFLNPRKAVPSYLSRRTWPAGRVLVRSATSFAMSSGPGVSVERRRPSGTHR